MNLVRQHPLTIAMLLLIFALTAIGEVYAATQAIGLRRDLCHIITASRSSTRADLEFQQGIYNRAVIRARIEKHQLRGADVDAAAQAKRHIAQDEAALRFTFPGC